MNSSSSCDADAYSHWYFHMFAFVDAGDLFCDENVESGEKKKHLQVCKLRWWDDHRQFSHSREIKVLPSEKLQSHHRASPCSIQILFSKTGKLCLLVLRLVPWKLQIYVRFQCGHPAQPSELGGPKKNPIMVHFHHARHIWFLIFSLFPQLPINLGLVKVSSCS